MVPAAVVSVTTNRLVRPLADYPSRPFSCSPPQWRVERVGTGPPVDLSSVLPHSPAAASNACQQQVNMSAASKHVSSK